LTHPLKIAVLARSLP